MSQLLYVLLGLIAGISSGIFGIGGGTIVIPALVFLLGLTQHQAQGTTLAMMVPPIGLLAAMRYYQAGNVKLGMALFLCLGFFFGAYLGADLVQKVPDPLLKRLFGGLLFFISLKLIFFK